MYQTTQEPAEEAAKPTMEVPDGLREALPDLIDDATNHMESAYREKQEEMTDYYKGDLPGITEEDLNDGRSDIVSRDVHDALMATLPDLVRIFMGADHVVEFEPGGPDDDEVAPQATDAIRFIFEKENDAYRLVYGSLKDGLIRKYAVAHWYHEHVDKSFVKDYTLGVDELAAFLDSNQGEIEVIEAKAQDDKQTVEAKLRHVRHVHRFIVDLVPPEELIVSRRARNARGEHLIGRRRNLRHESLIAMGISQELIDKHGTSDATVEDNALAQNRKPDGDASGSDSEPEEALYVESYLEWPHEDRVQLFKVCTLGDGHEIVGCEPVDAVDMAVFTPDPEPHTVIGESQAEKVADIQRLKTGIWRGIVDSLAEALVPRTEVVEGQVNIDDAMSTEIGGLVRVRTANTVRPISTPFLGQQAIPLLENVDNMREERVGAFRAADGMSAEAMQSSTKMAVAATITGSKAQKELLARTYAETFLKPIFRGLLRLFVQHQDKAKMIRLRGKWVPVDPSAWNADMDCTVDVAQAMLTVEEKAAQLGAIAEKQEAILEKLGPINPICNLGHYAHTLREMVRLTGRKNVDAYFGQLPTAAQDLAKVMDEFSQFSPEPPPEPALVLAQAQVKSLDDDRKRKDAEMVRKREIEERQFKADEDFRRDELAQKRETDLKKIEAQFGAQVETTSARIAAEQEARRDEHGNAIVSQVIQQEHEREQADADRRHQAGEADKDRTTESTRHAVDTVVNADLQREKQQQQAKPEEKKQ